jgi:hypothetical protein
MDDPSGDWKSLGVVSHILLKWGAAVLRPYMIEKLAKLEQRVWVGSRPVPG